MTRKDYKLIADVIKATNAEYADIVGTSDRGGYPSLITEVVLTNLTVNLAQALHNENPRFDINKFMAACKFLGG